MLINGRTEVASTVPLYLRQMELTLACHCSQKGDIEESSRFNDWKLRASSIGVKMGVTSPSLEKVASESPSLDRLAS